MDIGSNSVCVVGLGYIGLPTAAIIASRGVPVIGVDVNARAVETINAGGVHIVEPDLDIAVRSTVSSGLLTATTEPQPAGVFVIAVPTPLQDDKSPDVSKVKAAALAIAPVLEAGNLVLLESTSPVGTTEQLVSWLTEARPDLRLPAADQPEADVRVAYCPERVLPGRVMQELITNDRIIGGISRFCAERAAEFYQLFVSGDLHRTDARTAEMVKLTENSFRDVNIAFANELSLICDRLGVNPWELIELANFHPRVNILNPGPGVGGHCIAVDPWFLVDSAPRQARLIRTSREVNDSKPAWVVEQARGAAARLEAPAIACLGLAFKANIDDLRESPAIEIVESLADAGIGQLLVVEPNIDALPQSLDARDGVELVSLEGALSRANVLLVLVDHREFSDLRHVDRDRYQIIDTCGLCYNSLRP